MNCDRYQTLVHSVAATSTYVAVVEHLVHVDALRVEERLLLARPGGAFAEEAARQALGLHDDSVLGQGGQDRRQVKVHLAHRQDQLHLLAKDRRHR